MSQRLRAADRTLIRAQIARDTAAPGPSDATNARRVGTAIWRTATSVRTALLLMLILAGLGLIGTLLEQAPADIGADQQAHDAWLASVRPTFGPWTDVLDRLGAFSIFGSPWFLATVGALAGCILACSVNRVRGIRNVAFAPPHPAGPAFFERARHVASVETRLDAASAAERVRAALRAHRYRVFVMNRPTTTDGTAAPVDIYADRHRFAPFGTLVAHLGLLVILAGVFAGSAWGFRNPAFVVAVGSKADVGHGTGLSVEATSFTDSYYMDGSPSDYATDLVVYRDGRQVATQTVHVNQPLRYGDVSLYQSFFGPAVVIRATGNGGVVAFDAGVPLVWASSDGSHSIGQFTVPSAGLTFYVAAPASGSLDPALEAGQIQLEAYRTADETVPLDSQIVSQGSSVRMEGLDFTFVRERQYTGLIVARDPGLPLVFGGALLLMAGTTAVFVFRPRRLWGLVRPVGHGSLVMVGATSRRDSTFARSFDRLTGALRDALETTSPGGR